MKMVGVEVYVHFIFVFGINIYSRVILFLFHRSRIAETLSCSKEDIMEPVYVNISTDITNTYLNYCINSQLPTMHPENYMKIISIQN